MPSIPRATLSILVLVSVFLTVSVNALSGAILRHNDLMASMGLLPDGTAMDDENLDEDWWEASNTVNRLQAPNNTVELIQTEYVELPIDHFGEGRGTFRNRFWVAEAGYQKGGPVFVYDVGEANASTGGTHLQRLRNNTSFFKQIVDHFGGIGIVWEHRFYGNSSPYDISLDTPATKFEYLTTEQALADLPTFAWGFKRKNLASINLTPSGTPWVFIGGSYPGMRAAFMRRYYPGTIFAAWASSAPVQSALDMSFYFEPVWQGMQALGWTNCTNDIRASVLEMDKIMENPARSVALKEAFLGRTAGNSSNAGFADALSTIFYLWQSYGVDGGVQGLRSFCNWISKDPKTNTTAPASGWAAIKGADFTINRWASWPAFAATVNDNLFTACEGNRKIDVTKIPNCNLEERFPDPASISWTWQYCTQWGFFQSANLGPHQLISKYNSLQHWADICQRQFPDGRKSGLLPAWPDVDTTNEIFGGWKIRPSNTLWTGGEYDPWRTLSPLSQESFSPKYVLSKEIPDCGRPFKIERELFADLIPNAMHAFDFRPSFKASKSTRDLFVASLEKWLKCWKEPRIGNITSPIDGGGTWGAGHYNPSTGRTGALPDPNDEEGWAGELRKAKKHFVNLLKRSVQRSVPSPPDKVQHTRPMGKTKLRTVPLP
ncbi:peptidase S28 [Venturia nashicola]|uniref:Peptidase S28 n=1 Tax=Venturia nashicola TaxID=86259 RepID=A0A4Z1NT95_9PEZI|nr:peptidase S28 [Venturia nashicola]TLD29917.1 peptidase S28 [Venturia nashicola]